MATRKIKDAKDLSTQELIYFKGHAKATFMSDGATVEDAVRAVENATYKNKGYFPTLAELQSAFPEGSAGSRAYVGSTYPYSIYLWQNGAWVDSGATGGDESVDLASYYTKSETDTKLTELSEETERIVSVVDGMTWQDVSTTLTDTYYVYAKDNQLLGDTFYNASYIATDYIDVSDTSRILITCASDSVDKGLAFYDSDKVVIEGMIFNDVTPNNDVRELQIPKGAYYVRSTINKEISQDFVCKKFIQGQPLVEQINAKADKSYVDKEIQNFAKDVQFNINLLSESDRQISQEVTELSAEVEECSSILKGKTWQDINVRFTDEYYVYAKDNHLIGDIFYNANYKATEFIEVANTDKIRITCASCNGENADKGLVFYDSAKNVIVGLIFSDGTENNAVRELDIPTNAQYVRTTFNKSVGGEFLCQLLLEGESLVSQLEGKAEKKDVEEYDARIMAQDTQSIIAIDLMQLIHSQNKINSIDCLPVISSNSTSITLSQENASYFPTSAEYGIAAVVGYRNGDYKVVYFAASNGNTISRASFETTDLTDVVSVQSVHDTLPNGQGQHLSQSGYIAMGKFVADEILKRTSFVDKNWIGGLVFNELELSRGYTDTDENNAIYDAGGNVVCTPIYNNWMWGGYTPNGSINTRGVEQNADIQKANGWLLKAYRFTQGKKGAYIEFPIKVNGRGFVKIQAANLLDGNCKMTLYADGVAIDATILKKNQTEYIWEDVTINNELRVRWEVMDDADVDVVIYSIGMWKMYPSIPLPLLDSVTRIAVLGDSWTQFPVLNNGLADFAEWNDVVVRPDNSQGDGYGYFPKALAQYTGAIVDNWGKSGMRADNWGLSSINKILDYARYDYLIYNFCINDYNANKTINEWKAVMKRIASKCKPFGTRPIFILPCCTDSPSQSFGLGEWHEATMRGLFVE